MDFYSLSIPHLEPSCLTFVRFFWDTPLLPTFSDVFSRFPQDFCVLLAFVILKNFPLSSLYKKLHEILVSLEILHADETVLQVLHEAGRNAQTKSYMWLYMTGAAEARQIALYEYQPGRGGEYPVKFLSGFHGYLQTDGYDGYNGVEGVTRLGCWAHLRRKFDEAVKALPKGAKTGAAVTGQAYCTELFMIERGLQCLPPEKRYEERLKREKPLLDEFRTWADARTVAPKSKLGQAFSYLANQ